MEPKGNPLTEKSATVLDMCANYSMRRMSEINPAILH